MSDVRYSLQEWQDSVEQAVNSGWNRTLSYLSDWPLSMWLIDQVRPHILDKHPEQDVAELMEAVVNVLEGEDFEDFSPEKYLTVLQSFNGSTSDDFEKLIEEHVTEQGTPEHLVSTLLDGIQDPEAWYFARVVPDGEVCTDTDAGGTAYWFKRDRW